MLCGSMIRFRSLPARICGKSSSPSMETRAHARKKSVNENAIRAMRPISANCSLEEKNYGSQVLNSVDNFLQKSRKKGLAHTAILQQPMLMELRTRSWMAPSVTNTLGNASQALGPTAMNCTKTGQCACGRDHGPRVFFAMQKSSVRRTRRDSSPRRALPARACLRRERICSPLHTPPSRSPRPSRVSPPRRTSSPPSRPLSARPSVERPRSSAMLSSPIPSISSHRSRDGDPAGSSPPSRLSSARRSTERSATLRSPIPSRSPRLCTDPTCFSYAELRGSTSPLRGKTSPRQSPPISRTRQASRPSPPRRTSSTSQSSSPSKRWPPISRAFPSNIGLSQDEVSTKTKNVSAQNASQAVTPGQQSERSRGRSPGPLSREMSKWGGGHKDSSLAPPRASPFLSSRTLSQQILHKDPMVEHEERYWRKKQASYDLEDEALSDLPVSATDKEEDSLRIKQSLKNNFDIDNFVESRTDMSQRGDFFDYFENEGVDTSTEVARLETRQAEAYLEKLKISKQYPNGSSSRAIFCSRTLSLRTITTIGYDMDYTLIHYNVKAWEGRAYEYGLKNLSMLGYPVDGLKFDNHLVIRGLILDKEKGNLVKADRFGHIKRAMHGMKMLSSRIISEVYGAELVNLRDDHRWEFLNTLFSMSESVMYMQMVERLDNGALPPELGNVDYETLYAAVSRALFRAHIEGQLKAEIFNNPDKFVELDAELPLALLDQKDAGKRLLLITNSEYLYTEKMMAYAFNPFLPKGMNWRGLFDMVIVSARKPEFFQKSSPLYEIVTEDGLMRPCNEPTKGGLYCGGSAFMIEKALGSEGGETLYVGDHIYTDVSQSKVNLRWRTALICRELEREVKAMSRGRSHRAKLIELMNKKEVVGDVFNQLRLALQRRSRGRVAQTPEATKVDEKELEERMQKILSLMGRLDQKIAPMLEADGQHFNPKWGYLSRAGLWDKSHLTRQIEKYADIYTSRVANFGRYSPFMYFRSQAQVLGENISSEKIPGIYDLMCAAELEDKHEPKPH